MNYEKEEDLKKQARAMFKRFYQAYVDLENQRIKDARHFLISTMKEKEFYKIIRSIKLECRKCGRCCREILTPLIVEFYPPQPFPYNLSDLRGLIKGRCKFLAKDNTYQCKHLAKDNTCEFHDDWEFKAKFRMCYEFPFLSARKAPLFEYVNEWSLVLALSTCCPIVREFWKKTYALYKAKMRFLREHGYYDER